MPLKQTALLLAFVTIATCSFGQQKSIKLPPDDPMAQLKPGPGVEIARRSCAACHSTDYIVRQPKFDTSRWQAEVNKMINTYGAKITEPDAKTIAEYLGKTYSPQ
jgi:sulfite dehydrogenase (cytochrome) subunit B